MNGHDIQRLTAARAAFIEALDRQSPEIWRVLSDPGIGFTFVADALVFSFDPDNRDVFDRLMMDRSRGILRNAARAAGINLRFTAGDETVLIEAA